MIEKVNARQVASAVWVSQRSKSDAVRVGLNDDLS